MIAKWYLTLLEPCFESIDKKAKEKKMIPEPKGRPRLLTKKISVEPAKLGSPGMIKLLITTNATPPKKNAMAAPFKLGFSYFLK